MLGTVKWFDVEKGYGFISAPERGDDYFVHQTEVQTRGFRKLKAGEVVRFILVKTEKGLQAQKVVPLGKGSLVPYEMAARIIWDDGTEFPVRPKGEFTLEADSPLCCVREGKLYILAELPYPMIFVETDEGWIYPWDSGDVEYTSAEWPWKKLWCKIALENGARVREHWESLGSWFEEKRYGTVEVFDTIRQTWIFRSEPEIKK